ncbi:MAG: hypothetical protein HKN92_10060 [Chitinophagales bacterium]|nr:hypothetical protein [Chitinophagales bacterium]
MSWLFVFIASLELLTVINNKAEIVKVDVFDNVYTVKGSSLTKTAINGEKQTYSTSNSENITQIDISEIHKPLVYIEDKNQVVVLDLDLIELKTIDLNDQGLGKGRIAVTSSGNFWFYECESNTLVEITETGKVIQQIDYTHILKPTSTCDLFFTGGALYIKDNAGIHIFDKLGAYVRSIQQQGITSVEISGMICYFSTVDGIFNHDFRSNETTLLLEIASVLDIEVEKGQLYVCVPSGIKIYKLK